MEDSTDTQSNKEELPADIDCDNTNFSMISDLKSDEYNFETSNSSDSIYKLKPTNDENKDQEEDNEESLFDEDMDDFDANDFMKGSLLSEENLEIDKIMEQLNDSIENDIFANENIMDNNEDGDSNEGSLKDHDSSLENISELNLLNNDIISYINSDDTFSKDNTVDTLLDSIAEDDKITKTNSNKNQSSSLSNTDAVDKNDDTDKKDIIDLINKELDDTLQFTNVLCHYVYSDVIVGKDFYKLFSSETVKADVNVKAVDNAVVET